MFADPKGPITHFEWATFTIDSKIHSSEKGVGKDIFLSPEGVSAWHERKGHKLKADMVRRALALKPEVLIIGNGVEGALEIGKKARKEIEDAGVKLIVLRTPEACREYNRLYRHGKRVILLAHGTC